MTVTPSHDSDATFTGNSRGLTRRQVTSAAAWAAPVIALAVATPAHAASVPPVSQPQLSIADSSDINITDTNITFASSNVVFTLLNPTPTTNTGLIQFQLSWSSGFVLQNAPVQGATIGDWTVTNVTGSRIRVTHAALTQSSTTTIAPSFTVIKNGPETEGDRVDIAISGTNPGFTSAKTAGWASQL